MTPITDTNRLLPAETDDGAGCAFCEDGLPVTVHYVGVGEGLLCHACHDDRALWCPSCEGFVDRERCRRVQTYAGSGPGYNHLGEPPEYGYGCPTCGEVCDA